MSEINRILLELVQDRGIRREVRSTIEDSVQKLDSGSPEVVSGIISLLEEVSNDPNLSVPARTRIWNAVSILETL